VTACLLLVGLLTAEASARPVGMAYHYERVGALARVAAIRDMPIAWGRIDGLASISDCRWIDPARPYFVQARFWRGHAWGPIETYQIVDCAQYRDLPSHRRRGIAPYGIEIDRASADRNAFAWDGRRGKGKTKAQVGRPFR
jgi:hypothetical protein